MKNYIFILLVFTFSNVFAQYKISGTITYDNPSATPIQYADIILKNASGNIDTATTDQRGYYTFNEIPDGSYTLEIISYYSWGGVTPKDALIMMKYFVKQYTFKDLLTKRAADVNLDFKVNSTDALFASKRFVVQINFPAPDWLFDDVIININGQDIIQDIKSICSGDVDGSYSPVYKFINCGDFLTDERDGKAYKTVQIGNQCWFKHNLNIGTRIDGVNDQTDNGTIEKYCYDNDENNCYVYGGLYQWDEMMQYVTTEKTKGICPTGWHVPADAEWTMLIDNLGGENIAGDKLKEKGTTHWINNNVDASNSSGFTALPGGAINFSDGQFMMLGDYGLFWSSTELDGTYSLLKYLLNSNAGVYRYRDYKTNGFSVRCLKDCPPINAPGKGINIPSHDQIIWNWKAVAAATGYKWSMTNNYSTATDIGTSTSYSQNGLNCETNHKLYVWAYYNNQNCTNYSSASTLTENTSTCLPIPGCGDNLLDTRDGIAYKTVQIASHCWMAENLNTTKYLNGDDITNVLDNTLWSNLESEAYCNYQNDLNNAVIYGRLYNWYAVNDYRGLCPTGWHVPTDSEWSALIDYLGGWEIAGGKMKEAETAHWNSPNTGADNSSGFSGLPGGARFETGGPFGFKGIDGNWWSATENNYSSAWALNLFYETTIADLYYDYDMKMGMSVRCLMDCPSINAPGSGTNVPSQEQIIWKWQAVDGATGYKWSTTNYYAKATDLGTSTSYTQSGLNCNTSYTLYVWAYYNNQSCGNHSSATLLTQNTTESQYPSLIAPELGINTPSQNQIIWNWQPVQGATGYKWSTEDYYYTAADIGNNTSYTQQGLNCGTAYTLYVWAYNGNQNCGNYSSATLLTQNTTESPYPSLIAPGLGINTPSQDQIIWNWHAVSGAAGYKWNVENNLYTATDVGLATSYTQTGLHCGNSFKLYVWAYNSCTYSDVVILTQTMVACPPFVNCGDFLSDSRDSRAYRTVLIGNQCWMKENLNTGKLITTSLGQTNNSITEKYCYRGEEYMCYLFGGLYEWDEMMLYTTGDKAQGICPTGWHIPNDGEWTVLSNYLGGASVAGGKMKTTGTIEAGTGLWQNPNIGATNESGFSAIPTGYGDYDYSINHEVEGLWWTSSDNIYSTAWYYYIYNNNSELGRNNYLFGEPGLTVRCIKN